MGQIINRANGASLAFHFPKGKSSIPVEIHTAGQVVSGRLLLVHDPSSSTEFDVRFLIDVEERTMQKPAPTGRAELMQKPAATGYAELAREPDIDHAIQTMGRMRTPTAVPEADVEVLIPARTEEVQEGVIVGDGSSAFGAGSVLVEPTAAPVPVQRAEPADGLPPFPAPGETMKQPGVHLVKDGLPPAPPRPAPSSTEIPRMARDISELQAEANKDWK